MGGQNQSFVCRFGTELLETNDFLRNNLLQGGEQNNFRCIQSFDG